MRTPVLVASVLLAIGCSSTTPTAATPSEPIVVPEVRVTKTDPNDLPALFRAASDMLLGWGSGPEGRSFFVRQLRDMKFSQDLEGSTAQGLLRDL